MDAIISANGPASPIAKRIVVLDFRVLNIPIKLITGAVSSWERCLYPNAIHMARPIMGARPINDMAFFHPKMSDIGETITVEAAIAKLNAVTSAPLNTGNSLCFNHWVAIDNNAGNASDKPMA